MDFRSIDAALAECNGVPGEAGVRLNVYRLHGSPPDAPLLVFGHANGFSAGSYAPMLKSLVPHFQVVAFDVRGHGGSQAPPDPLEQSMTFDCFAADLRAITNFALEQYAPPATYFAGHSFSAASMFFLGGVLGFTPWTKVVTFDATLLPGDLPALEAHAREVTVERVAAAKRRRAQWEDPQSFRAALGRPGRFDNWDPAMLDAHVRATLHPSPDGGLELACRPEHEAAVYVGVSDTRPYMGLTQFAPETHLVGADPACGGTWVADVQPHAAARLPDGRYSVLPKSGHLMPFEQPRACADLILAML